MIWLFKVAQTFWPNKPRVNNFYMFETDDIHFDITKYDVPLYMGTVDYYMLNDLKDNQIYKLQFKSINTNPYRIPIPQNTENYEMIKNYYIKLTNDNPDNYPNPNDKT